MSDILSILIGVAGATVLLIYSFRQNDKTRNSTLVRYANYFALVMVWVLFGIAAIFSWKSAKLSEGTRIRRPRSSVRPRFPISQASLYGLNQSQSRLLHAKPVTYSYNNANRLDGRLGAGRSVTGVYDKIGNTTVKWHQGQVPLTMVYEAASRLVSNMQGP